MQVVQTGLTALGFKTSIKAVPQQTMYSKFCGYVKAHVNVCPTAGWIEDFPDPYAALYIPFSGDAIIPINNSNWASSTTRRSTTRSTRRGNHQPDRALPGVRSG